MTAGVAAPVLSVRKVRVLARAVRPHLWGDLRLSRTVPGSGEDRWDLTTHRPPEYEREVLLAGVPLAEVEAYLWQFPLTRPRATTRLVRALAAVEEPTPG